MFPLAGVMLGPRHGLRPTVLPESKNMSKRIKGFPRNLGDPVVSTTISGGVPDDQLQAGVTAHITPDRNRVQRGTAERRQRSEAGRTSGSHSVSIVPVKLGNDIRSIPAEGSETSNQRTVFEKHDECIAIRESCPPNRDG